jgi:hypothetical protein
LSWPCRKAMPPPCPGTTPGSGKDRDSVGSCERHESRSRIYTAEGVVSKSWNGVAILVRGTDPVESRRGLPGDPEDVQSRYIETEVEGILVDAVDRNITPVRISAGRIEHGRNGQAA